MKIGIIFDFVDFDAFKINLHNSSLKANYLHFEVITGDEDEGSFLLSNNSSSGMGCGIFRVTLSLSAGNAVRWGGVSNVA